MSFPGTSILVRATEVWNGVTCRVAELMTPSLLATKGLRSATTVAVGVSIAAVAVIFVAYVTGNGEFLFARKGRFGRGRRKRYAPLTLQQWREAFDPVLGVVRDGGENVIDVMRRGGIEQRIRKEVWPFVLGLYDFSSTREEREAEKEKKREEYEELRRLCVVAQRCLVDYAGAQMHASPVAKAGEAEASGSHQLFAGTEEQGLEASSSPDGADSRAAFQLAANNDEPVGESAIIDDAGGMDGVTRVEAELSRNLSVLGDYDPKWLINTSQAVEDFGTWQRIIRLDAIRINADWVPFSSLQESVTEETAAALAEEVGLKDSENLDAARKYFGARLVAILEAYTLHDSETGYCQGMSDLLTPLVALMEDDFEAFWCFRNFMRAARHNFRMDETGIQRQLDLVSRILKAGDPELYEHLVRIRSEDCTFVYRMILVFLRRELTFEQSLCLWEVIWADWAVLRRDQVPPAGSKSITPASSDLLLYTIAAAVRNKKDHILEYCRGMDDMLKECNDMAGHLDVWVLLDDARELVRSIQGAV